MIDMNHLKSEFLLSLTEENWARSEKHKKNSYWLTDFERPGFDIYCKWTDVQETNPPSPSALLMFRAAAAFEHAIVKNLVAIGEAVDLEDKELCDSLGLNIIQRSGDIPQIRVEMERDYCPWTGYLDACAPDKRPLEVKSYYSSRVDSDLARGKAPSSHHLKQLGGQIDFMGTLSGTLIMANRSTGKIFFTELRRESVDSLHFEVGDRSMDCVEPEDENDDESEARGSLEGDDGEIVGEVYEFDLNDDYRIARSLMETNIIPRKEPKLDYQYKPPITKQLLDYYAGKDGKFTEIRRAIKGQRVLSDHRWRVQYSSYKDLWIAREMEQKGFKTMEELCAYTPTEILFMLEYANLTYKKTKDGKWMRDKQGNRKLFKRKFA